jgi:hypothetical protein
MESQSMTIPFLQYEDEPPRFYEFDQHDWTRSFENAMRVPLHIWLLSDSTGQLPHQLPSVFSQYGVVTDRSFYCPIFTRTDNGLLWVACPCDAGRWRKPCRHLAGNYNFHVWREDAGMIGREVLEGDGRRGLPPLPRRFTC